MSGSDRGAIERAANAVENTIFNPALRADIHIQCDDPRRVHVAIARAVIAAIREPSTEMLGDVHDTLLYHIKGNEMDTARIVWDRFIEVLLEDGE